VRVATHHARDEASFAQWAGACAEWITAFLLSRWAAAARKPKRNMTLALAVVFGLACTVAVGQTGGAAAPSGDITSSYGGLSAQSVVSDISAAVMNELDKLSRNSALESAGKYITASLLLIMMTWTLVKTMASGRGISDIFAEWTPILVGFGVVTLFLDKNVGKLIVTTMHSIAAAIAGTSMSSLDAAIHAALDPIFKAITAVVTQPSVTTGTKASGWDLLGVLSWVAMNAAAALMSVMAALATAFFLIMAAVVMAGHIIVAFISVQVVLALAPVMVPFLMFRPLAWVFDSWLKFLLGACMLKIVVAFLMNVIAGLTTAMNGVSARYYAEATKLSATGAFHTDVILLGLMVVFAMLATLLLMRAPEIASGLLAGNSGSAGFGGLRGVSGGLGNRIGAQGAQDLIGGGASGVRSGAQNLARKGIRRLPWR
jgi:type IV secretion system protein TrbL